MNDEFEKDLEAPPQGTGIVVDLTKPKPSHWEDRGAKFEPVEPTEDAPAQETPPVPFAKVEEVVDEDPDLLLDTGDPVSMDPAMWDNDPVEVDVSEAQVDEDEEAVDNPVE